MFLDFFDEVYVISLVDRPERREDITKELHEYGIPHTFFDAIKDENGAKGLIMTMQKLFRQIMNEGQTNVLVLEDDSQFIFPPVPFLQQLIPQFPTNYHLMYLGLNLLTEPIKVSENVLKIGMAYATHAIAYSRQAIELILPLLHPENLVPYDVFLTQKVQPLGKSYCTYPMFATQRDSVSDIADFESFERQTHLHKYLDIPNRIIKWGDLMAERYAYHTKNLQVQFEPIVVKEDRKCKGFHGINGAMPQGSDIQFDNITCDCGKIMFYKEPCGCPGSQDGYFLRSKPNENWNPNA